MTATRVSTSESFRKEGNSFYAQSRSEGLAPILKISKLEKASALYNKALQAANNSDEMSSAHKNLGQVSWEIAVLVKAEEKSFNEIGYLFKEAITNFYKAENVGLLCKTPSWIDQVKGSRSQCLESAFQKYMEFSYSMHMGGLECLSSLLEDDEHKVICMTQIGQKLFHLSIKALAKKDYKTSLHHLKECYRPIEEMKRLGAHSPSILAEARVLSGDVLLHTATAESMQAIAFGDALLDKALMENEELKMSLIMEILDWYVEALKCARDIEVEHEAIASSRIGNVYDKILKMPYKAKKYYMHCLQLAHSAAPKNFTSEEWFKLARTRVELFQRECLVEQLRKEEALRQEHLKDYQVQLRQLRQLQQQYSPVTQHRFLILTIYKNFPPKNPEHKLPSEKELENMPFSDIKKVLLKACLHYHPDKQDAAQHGLGWKYFSDEITKVFTNAYEMYKG